jgi:hypothetical protein
MARFLKTRRKVIEYEESKSEVDLYYLIINYLLISNIFQKSWQKVIKDLKSESAVGFIIFVIIDFLRPEKALRRERAERVGGRPLLV